jgi:hypothetical protein
VRPSSEGCAQLLCRTGGEGVSRRVDELVSEQARGRESSWTTQRAERAGRPTPGLLHLRRRRDGIPAPLVTHRCPRPAVAESIPEQRSARGQSRLIESLGTL